jgi:hypothetical protein
MFIDDLGQSYPTALCAAPGWYAVFRQHDGKASKRLPLVCWAFMSEGGRGLHGIVQKPGGSFTSAEHMQPDPGMTFDGYHHESEV